MYSFSPVWIPMWTFMSKLYVQTLPHVLHEYADSLGPYVSKHVHMTNDSVYFTVLPRGYLPSYIYGFLSAWTLLCFVNSLLDIQPFPHTLQGYGLSPVWNLI